MIAPNTSPMGQMSLTRCDAAAAEMAMRLIGIS